MNKTEAAWWKLQPTALATSPVQPNMASKSRSSLRDEPDDLYEGYADASALEAQKELLDDPGLQRGIQSSYGERDRLGTARRNLLSAKPRPKLSTGKNSDAYRPASSIRGAGYTAKSGRSSASSGVGSPSGRLSSGTPVIVPTLEPGENDQPSRSAINSFRKLEKEIQTLLDSAALFVAQNQHAKAAEKIKQSEKMRRKLQEIPDWNLAEKKAVLQPLLTKMSWYNAEVLVASHKFDDAMRIYTELRNTVSAEEQSTILMRIALLHRRRKEYEEALRVLHKMLDDLPTDSTHDRMVVLAEAAACHAMNKRWDTAYKYCQMILQDSGSSQAAFNSLVCLIALKSDTRKIESAFIKLISLKNDSTSETEHPKNDSAISPEYRETTFHDPLDLWERQQYQRWETYVLNAAAMVATLEDDPIVGYDWCIEQAKNAGRPELMPSLEIAKAYSFLKAENFTKAIEVLSSHDNDLEDKNLRAKSCIMLAFLHYHMGNFKAFKECTEIAYASNKFNPQACINKGCLEYRNENFSGALQHFQEVLVLNSGDFRASYYAGMALIAMKNYQDALGVFSRLNDTHPNRPTVLYQLSHIYQQLDDSAEAFGYLEKVYTLHPRDPFVLHQLGAMADKLGDKGAALWYYNESYRVYPMNLEVLNWLGRFFVASQFPEKAITYFQQASTIDETIPKWLLLTAGAMRRAGHLTDAYQKYIEIHDSFPDDPDCLKVLIRICQETHAPAAEIAKYQQELDLIVRMRKTDNAASSDAISRNRSTQEASSPVAAIATAGKPVFGQTGFTSVRPVEKSVHRTAYDVDEQDLEEFNVQQRPSTGRKPVGKSTERKPSGDDLGVDEILPSMTR